MENMQLYLSGINYESVVDGIGVRTAIFLSGCSHNCPGCHNPETHNPRCGIPVTPALIREIAKNIMGKNFINGITLTGGDPLFDARNTASFVFFLEKEMEKINYEKAKKLTWWLYTGYTYEEICKNISLNPSINFIINLVDVVVDGKFIKGLADKTLAFRGSSNQRIIDVKKTLKESKVVIWNP